jgi:hypothetical protein
VLVTRLDTGAPVGGADVSIIRLDKGVAWCGRTDGQGLVVAPGLRLRTAANPWTFAFIVPAAEDGDVACVASDWHEGVELYAFVAPGSTCRGVRAIPDSRGAAGEDVLRVRHAGPRVTACMSKGKAKARHRGYGPEWR